MESLCKSAPPIIKEPPSSLSSASTYNSLGSSSVSGGNSVINAPKTATNHPSTATNRPLTGKRSNTVVSNETKYQLTITSDRLAELRRKVEDALREHKTFTLKGGWNALRRSLLNRDWIEKYEPSSKSQKGGAPSTAVSVVGPTANLDDLCTNLPTKQTWESPAVHKEKCEKTIMSRLLQMHEVDFFWSTRKDQNDWHRRVQTTKIINRFSRSLFTSKEGLSLLLQQMHWHNEPGVAYVNYPRCYVLGFPDHFQNFVEDFRLTACIGLLKFFVERYESATELVQSPEGTVPLSAVKFALTRCDDYVACKKHLDIDRNLAKVWDHEWDQFLSQFYAIVHHNEQFLQTKDHSMPMLYATAKSGLMEVANYWPQYHLDGCRNIWILKPGNKCRGRGIQLIRNIEDVAKIMHMKLKYVVQKYIERPLIIYKTKFDIRQWFLLTSAQPLQIWMYRENYLRFSSQIFSLDNFHESLHLTNHAVQCKYTNVNQRDKNLPEENMWDCYTFKNYLKKIGHPDKWDKVIFPGMRECIVGAMLASQETMDRRANTFELYGADFILAEDYTPWLLEINSSPDLSSSTSVTARMCPQCLEDIVKVIIDKRRDPKAETGQFELVYKQMLPRPPAYLGMSLSIRGRKLFRHNQKNRRNYDGNNDDDPHHHHLHQQMSYAIPSNSAAIGSNLLEEIQCGRYEGPVIKDFIDDIQRAYFDASSGVDFVPAQKKTVPTAANNGAKKAKKKTNKNDRVSRTNGGNERKTANRRCCLSNRKANGSGCVKGAYARRIPLLTTYQPRLTTMRSAAIGGDERRTRDSDGFVSGDANNWERNTASILRGKLAACRFGTGNGAINSNNNNSDSNKGDVKKRTGRFNDDFNLSPIDAQFLTVGTGYPKTTTPKNERARLGFR